MNDCVVCQAIAVGEGFCADGRSELVFVGTIHNK